MSNQALPSLTPEQIARYNAMTPEELAHRLGSACGVTEQNIVKSLTEARLYQVLPQMLDYSAPGRLNPAIDFFNPPDGSVRGVDTNDMRAAILLAARIADQQNIRLDQVSIADVASHRQEGCALAAQIGGFEPPPASCAAAPDMGKIDMSSLIRGGR